MTESIKLPDGAKVVLCDGPYETDGDGGYDYCVCFGDNDGEVIGDKRTMWRCDSFDSAVDWAGKLAARFHLELVQEASRP